MSRQRGQGFLGQGGVALADILANSVAVILIMIIITITVQQERAKDEVEKNANLTTILARQLAATVVFNDLPSSPPARLHDYNSCEIPHDCDPYLFPIIELHRGYIRIFNTNTRIHRRELLRPYNAFDRYLQSLDALQAASIRIDIHDISEYYLALGIIAEHQLRAAHWHYLGEHVEGLANPLVAENTAGVQGREELPERNGTDGDPSGQGADGQWQDGGGWQRSGQKGQQGQLPALGMGTQQADANTLGLLRYDRLLPPAHGGGQGQLPEGGGQDRLNSQPRGGPSSNKPTTFFEMMLEPDGGAPGSPGSQSPPGQQSQAGEPGERRTMRLYAPNVRSDPSASAPSIDLPPERYTRVILTFLFQVLAEAREQKTFALTSINGLAQKIANEYDTIHTLPHADLVERLARQLDAGIQPAHTPLAGTQRVDLGRNRLLVEYNRPLGRQMLQLSNPITGLDALLKRETVQPQFLLRLYPSLFWGEVLDVPPGYTLLLLPDEAEQPRARWRPIAVIDSDATNISLGFLYAGVVDDKLAIEAGVNQLRLSNVPVTNPIISERDESQSGALWVWLLGAALLLLLAVRMQARLR